MSGKYQERLTQLESVLLLNKSRIDLDDLRTACAQGIPEKFRPLCWRLLLDYLPLERVAWPAFLRKHRETYNSLIEDIIVQPGCSSDASNDHPLSLSPTSEWTHYFKDNEVLVQIDKDVRRLCPEIGFFHRTTKFPNRLAAKINLSKRIRHENLQSEVYDNKYSGTRNAVFLSPSKVAPTEYSNEVTNDEVEFHWQVVERILFIYSKLNPGIKYVQGMNEILGPLYFVFANDSDTEWSMYAEADAYYCFQLLMSEIKDNFIKTLDSSNCGIESTMSQFCERIRACDADLYEHLTVQLSIKPQFYAFRWLSLLLSQEFPLPDVITIWDSLFSSPNRVSFLQWVSVAMVVRERDALLNGDFSACLRLLQNYPEVDVGMLVSLAHQMKDGNCRQHSSMGTNRSRDTCGGKGPVTQANKIAAVLSSAVRSLTKK